MQMTADQLKPNFEPFGPIEEVTIIYDKTTHTSKGARTFSTVPPPPARSRPAPPLRPLAPPAAIMTTCARTPLSARPLGIGRVWLRDLLDGGVGARGD